MTSIPLNFLISPGYHHHRCHITQMRNIPQELVDKIIDHLGEIHRATCVLDISTQNLTVFNGFAPMRQSHPTSPLQISLLRAWTRPEEMKNDYRTRPIRCISARPHAVLALRKYIRGFSRPPPCSHQYQGSNFQPMWGFLFARRRIPPDTSGIQLGGTCYQPSADRGKSEIALR